MAEVRMNLNEYDKLKGELEFYKSIVEKLTTVAYDEWSFNYYKDHQSFSVNSLEIDEPKIVEFLKECILENLPKEYKDLNRTLDLSPIRLSLGYLVREEEEVTETTEEGS